MSALRKFQRSIAKAQGIPLIVTSRSGRAKIRKHQQAQAANAEAAKLAAASAVAADPSLATLSDEELAARNLANAK